MKRIAILFAVAALFCFNSCKQPINPLDSEWWHFTLKDEPYPDTYFTFPVY